MSTELILLAVIAFIVLLAVLEKHLERISEAGGRLAEQLKDRLVIRTIALFITVGIILAFSEVTHVDMATELFATVAASVGITVATVVENELELAEVT